MSQKSRADQKKRRKKGFFWYSSSLNVKQIEFNKNKNNFILFIAYQL